MEVEDLLRQGEWEGYFGYFCMRVGLSDMAKFQRNTPLVLVSTTYPCGANHLALGCGAH